MSFDPSNRKFEFVQPVAERYVCVACGNILSDPVQSPCGHRFCKVCVDAILGSPEPKCPKDGDILDIKLTFKDRCALKEIQVLDCFCPERQHGCRWTGKVEDFENHAKKECPFTKVPCLYVSQGCDKILFRCQLAKHVEKDCAYRPVQCMYCQGEVPQNKLSEHLEMCPKCPLDCTNGCPLEEILREHMEEHILTNCPLTLTHCSFQTAGCTFQGPKNSLEDHIKSKEAEHLLLAGKLAEESQSKLQELELHLAIVTDSNKLLESQLAIQKEALATAREALSTQKVKLTKVEQFVSSQKESLSEIALKVNEASNSKEMTFMQEQVREIQDQVTVHEEKLRKLESDLESSARPAGPSTLASPSILRRLEQLEYSLSLHNIQLADHDRKVQILEATTFDGAFVWKIDDYKQRFQEAISGQTPSLYSPSFYTSRFGYKLCARLYLDGDGNGKGSHLSLFIVLMRGEHDALLAWPFRKKITLKLLDQDKIQDITETFRPDSNSSSFQRPRSEMNIASGCPLFCSHAVLKTRGYTCDNTIYVKVIIDKNGATAL